MQRWGASWSFDLKKICTQPNGPVAVHSPKQVLGPGQAGGEGGGGLALHRSTRSTRSYENDCPTAMRWGSPVLGPFKISSSAAPSTGLLLRIFPSSEVTTAKSFLAAQNGVWGDTFLMEGCLSLRQAQGWLLSPPSTSCVSSDRDMESQAPHLSGGDNRSLSGGCEVSEVRQVSSCPTRDRPSLPLPLPFPVLSLPLWTRRIKSLANSLLVAE